jgi:hypothetical protein
MARGLKAALTALAAFAAPLARPKPQRLVLGAWRGAGADILNRQALDYMRTAIVASLWAEQPARQCAVQTSYTLRPSEQDRALLPLTSAHTKPLEPVGARAVWAKMQAAGIQFTDGGDVAVKMGAEARALSSVSRLPRSHKMAAAIAEAA